MSELKKNGDLARETILRKTTLDDCKGEKFEELLAVFSTAVLRKVLAVSADETFWTPAMKLSTASAISPADYQNTLPLILAHQVSLGAVGERRSRVREAYDQFSRLLDDKKVELAERSKKDSGSDGNQIQGNYESLASELRANWFGSEEWATALLAGGSQGSTDAFLELPFTEAWARATASTVDNLNSGLKQDLVSDLEARVSHQRNRLRRWHEYSDSIRKAHDGGSCAAETMSQEPRLLLRDHQSLTVASISKAVRQPTDGGRTLKSTDQSLISSVNEAITRINGEARVVSGPVHVPPTAVSMNDTEPPRVSTQSPSRNPESPPSPAADSGQAPDTQQDPDLPPLHSEIQTGLGQLHPPPVVRLDPESPSSESDSQPEPEPEPTKTPRSNYTLIERTRKSMSLIPPQTNDTQSRSRPRRAPRPSFPVNQFETKRKSSTTNGPGARSGASTPQDKLFEEDVDYASVFKSRPRVALSPISSPAVHVSPSWEEDEDFELDDGDVDSPLAVPRYRGSH